MLDAAALAALGEESHDIAGAGRLGFGGGDRNRLGSRDEPGLTPAERAILKVVANIASVMVDTIYPVGKILLGDTTHLVVESWWLAPGGLWRNLDTNLTTLYELTHLRTPSSQETRRERAVV